MIFGHPNPASDAFSSEVESGSREENASKYKARDFHRFHKTVKVSGFSLP